MPALQDICRSSNRVARAAGIVKGTGEQARQIFFRELLWVDPRSLRKQHIEHSPLFCGHHRRYLSGDTRVGLCPARHVKQRNANQSTSKYKQPREENITQSTNTNTKHKHKHKTQSQKTYKNTKHQT
jgi:hypothetical protein